MTTAARRHLASISHSRRSRRGRTSHIMQDRARQGVGQTCSAAEAAQQEATLHRQRAREQEVWPVSLSGDRRLASGDISIRCFLSCCNRRFRCCFGRSRAAMKTRGAARSSFPVSCHEIVSRGRHPSVGLDVCTCRLVLHAVRGDIRPLGPLISPELASRRRQ